MSQQLSFKQTQQQFSRVKAAYQEKEAALKAVFQEKGLNYNDFRVFIRAFKKEKTVEIWIKEKGKDTYSLLQTYDFCSSSGTLGPKRKEGDLQIPEGIYQINHFNPQSNFHLSLGISYPNASDRILSDPKHPGGAIYIHGNCVTIGCIPITDDKIKELYILAVEARDNGQKNIPVHIFPCKLDAQGLNDLKEEYTPSSDLVKFWENLKMAFDDFEKTRTVRTYNVNSKGQYY
jgi:murein L,D-transpeptidase YafK